MVPYTSLAQDQASQDSMMEEGDNSMPPTLTEQLRTVADFWGRKSHFLLRVWLCIGQSCSTKSFTSGVIEVVQTGKGVLCYEKGGKRGRLGSGRRESRRLGDCDQKTFY